MLLFTFLPHLPHLAHAPSATLIVSSARDKVGDKVGLTSDRQSEGMWEPAPESLPLYLPLFSLSLSLSSLTHNVFFAACMEDKSCQMSACKLVKVFKEGKVLLRSVELSVDSVDVLNE